jgi:RNA polymerase sigma-54 factor
VVRKISDEYVIQLNEDGLPRLRISATYRRMLRRGNASLPGDAKSYLKDKMRSAMWLIKSLDQRQRTIYKVSDSIVRHQRDFLDHGIEHLRPLVLRDVADDIGMHESTVSRVVSNKYIQTPRGLFAMKYFFHSGIDCSDGSDVSSLSIKNKIGKMIGEEDARHPLSDAKIMQRLRAEGIQIARRTVAKYREELRIPSSNQRKAIF